MMSFEDCLGNVSKEKFRNAANKLLVECFLLKKNKDTTAEYHFILNNREMVAAFFDLLGYELIVSEETGVICLNNAAGTGRIHLKKIESILLLILRLLYIEKKKQLLQTEDVIVLVDEIYDKYYMLKLSAKLDKTTLRNAMGLFRRYHLLSGLDADMSNTETRVIIYPSILFAVTGKSLDEIYRTAKERLTKYETGGAIEDADDEEADEN